MPGVSDAFQKSKSMDASHDQRHRFNASRPAEASSSSSGQRDACEANDGTSHAVFTASQSALYKSTSLTAPLRSLQLASFGRSASLTAGAAAAGSSTGSMPAPPSPSTDTTDSNSSLSGKLPSFSPVFTSFSRQASMDCHSRSLDLQDASRADKQAWSGPGGRLSLAASVPQSSAVNADAGSASQRSSFVFGEDMETTYRDWHNGVFAAL